MNEVIELEVLENYRIWLQLMDGKEKVINFRPYIGKGFTVELLDKEKFQKAFIEPGGGIAWENGYDFCPNYLKELAAGERWGVRAEIHDQYSRTCNGRKSRK